MDTSQANSYLLRLYSTKLLHSSSKIFILPTILVPLVLILFFTLNHPPLSDNPNNPYSLLSTSLFSSSFSVGGATWEKQVRYSATPSRSNGLTVLVTGAASFVGTRYSLALKKRGDGVLGLVNVNSYYDHALKRDRQKLLQEHQIFTVEGNLSDAALLTKLFDIVRFTHVLHLAAQAGVRYAMRNPQSYVASDVAGFINLLEVCKSLNPQPSIVWASWRSVYGLNSQVKNSESNSTNQAATSYGATEKAAEEMAHSYNHIYGLALAGFRFFTVYRPRGRADMAYFFFTKDIARGKPMDVYKTEDDEEVARDFTYVDDVVKGCLEALDTPENSTGSGGKKKGPAQLRVYNLGNPSPVAVGRFVSILENLLKTNAKQNIIGMATSVVKPYTSANVSSADRDFGYKLITDLANVLREFVKWCVSYFGIHAIVGNGIGRSVESD